MNKPFFFFLIAFVSLVLYSCEPAKQGGGDVAPANFNDGTIENSANNEAKTEVHQDSSTIIESNKKP